MIEPAGTANLATASLVSGFVLFSLLFLSACNNPTPEEDAMDFPATEIVTGELSPFYEFLRGEGSADDDAIAQANQTEVYEETIRQCMAEQGFEYFPQTAPTGFIDMTPRAPFATLEEFIAHAKTNGTGALASETESAVWEQRDTRNEDYVAGLDRGSRNAYNQAMESDMTGVGFNQDIPDDQRGCIDIASDKSFGKTNIDFLELLDTLENTVNGHPDVPGIEAAFVGCVAEKGYGWITSVGAVRELVPAQFEQSYTGDYSEDGDPFRDFDREVAVDIARCLMTYEHAMWRVRFAVETEFLALEGDRIALMMLP